MSEQLINLEVEAPAPNVDRSLHEYEARLRRAEAELRWSNEHLRMVVDGAVDYAIFMVDPEGNVLTWNEGPSA